MLSSRCAGSTSLLKENKEKISQRTNHSKNQLKKNVKKCNFSANNVALLLEHFLKSYKFTSSQFIYNFKKFIYFQKIDFPTKHTDEVVYKKDISKGNAYRSGSL